MSLEHYKIKHRHENLQKFIRESNVIFSSDSLSIYYTHRTQNRKPKFDSIHFEESVKPYAEDLTLENQYEK
jgi:hypothetical protein